MSYKVVNQFREKHDKNRVYSAGDPYPFEAGGYSPTKKRLEYLSKPNPKFDNKVFLEKVAESEKVEKKEAKPKANKEKKKG